MADRVIQISVDNMEIVPGVFSVFAFGHTIGHMGVRIHSGSSPDLYCLGTCAKFFLFTSSRGYCFN